MLHFAVVHLRVLGAMGAAGFTMGCSLDDRSLMVAYDGVDSMGTDAGDLGGPDGAGATLSFIVCKGTPVDSALITDFSDAVPGTNPQGDPFIAIGSDDASVLLRGGSYTYHAPGLSPPVLSLEPRGDGQALRVMASPGTPISSEYAWSGFGLGLSPPAGNCIDASKYSGVEFTLEGGLIGCQLLFGVLFSQDNAVTDNPTAGSCENAGVCTPPFSGVLTPDTTGLITVSFGALSGGIPVNRVDVTTITGVQWQIVPTPDSSVPCMASFLIDGISFYR
jgi:hypothetical protein